MLLWSGLFSDLIGSSDLKVLQCSFNLFLRLWARLSIVSFLWAACLCIYTHIFFYWILVLTFRSSLYIGEFALCLWFVTSSFFQFDISILSLLWCFFSGSASAMKLSYFTWTIRKLSWFSRKRILEWAAVSHSRGPFSPRSRACVACVAGRLCTTEPPGNPSGIFCQ